MRNLTLTSISRYIVTGALLTACGKDYSNSKPRASYSAPFPKQVAINLPQFIGNQITTASGIDTNTYDVDYDTSSHLSYIMDETCDTVFAGSAHKMAGLLYLNYQLNDSSWWYNGFLSTNNGIVGFLEVNQQRRIMDEELASAELEAHDNSYRIEASKKAIHDFYSKALEQSTTKQIIHQEFPHRPSVAQDPGRREKEPTTQDALYIKRTAKLVSRIGANPETSAFRLLFTKKAKYDIKVYNSLGKTVHHTVIDDVNADLDFSYLPEGNYLILVVDPKTNEQDTRKLVVASI